MGPRQSCDAKRASRTARDASRHLVALVGLLCRRAVHDYALYAMLAVGSEAPCATWARMCAALVGLVCEGEPPQRGRRRGTWVLDGREPAKCQDASFKVPLAAGPRERRMVVWCGSAPEHTRNTPRNTCVPCTSLHETARYSMFTKHAGLVWKSRPENPGAPRARI